MESEQEDKPQVDVVKRKAGRPKGSRNIKPTMVPIEIGRNAITHRPNDDYRHADPGAIISRQITMLDWAQQSVRNTMKVIHEDKHAELHVRDIEKLEKMSNGILRIIEALRKYSDLAEELSKRMSAEQLFEAAIKKIEGQDIATINSVIRRLRLYRATIAPEHNGDKVQMMDAQNATDAIAALETE